MAFYPCVNNAEFDKLLNGSIEKVKTNVSTLRAGAFGSCVNLTEVDIPNVTTLPSSCFNNCPSLESINLPNITTVIPSNNFQGCTSLREVIFNDINTIPIGMFYGCSVLEALVLRKNSLVSIISTQPFTNTPFWTNKSGGTLYVPSALVSTYENDTTWASVLALNPNNQIKAIEGSPYEN